MQHHCCFVVLSVTILGSNCLHSVQSYHFVVFPRLVGEQRQKNADAERLEGQALKARMEASAAAERIHHCQNSLQAEEGRLAAKKHEINLKVCIL